MNGNKKTPVKGDDIKSMLTNSPQVSGGSGSTKKEVKAFMQDLPNKGETNVVGGAGPLGWVVGTGAKAAKGIFNFLKSTPLQTIRSAVTRKTPIDLAKATKAKTYLAKPTTTGLSQNAMAGKDMAKSLNNSPFTPAQKVEAMNLLKQLKKPVNTKSQPMMRKQKPGEEIYRGDGKWYRGDGSMGQNLNI